MRVLSLFSGIGGFDLGLERAGMTVVGQVEIDPTCLRVLEHHWPDVRRWTDVRSVGCEREPASRDEAHAHQPSTDERRGEAGSGLPGGVDLICGGFPCQDLSVAGQRAGLDGARSGLWFEFQRILRELRPRWALIENVPGLLSSSQGRDFAVVLDGLGECGFGGIAWSVLDSQHFGVPQRRRRVFVVCGPTSRSAEAVLALCEGCGGHPQTGRAAGEDVAGEAGDGVAKPLGSHKSYRNDLGNDTYVPEIAVSLSFGTRGGHAAGRGDGCDTFVAHSLTADGFDASEDGTGRGTPMIVQEAQTGVREYVDAGSLRSDAPGTQPSGSLLRQGVSVRRLTPTECLRLQGLPDDWLDLMPELADGPKYRMVGNAVTVPVIQYLGERIMAIDGGRA